MWNNNDLICDNCGVIIESKKDCPRLDEKVYCDVCYIPPVGLRDVDVTDFLED